MQRATRRALRKRRVTPRRPRPRGVAPVHDLDGGNIDLSAELTIDGGYLVVSLRRSESIHGDRDKDGELSWSHINEEFDEVCGVGASRKPSCTPLFNLSYSEDEDDEVKHKWTLKMSLTHDALTLDADKKSRRKMDAEPRKLLGRHPLVFL
jgi:hypothetical protein